MWTFDQYLLRNFFYVFFVCFVAAFGLVVTIDLLENLDEFMLNNQGGGALSLLISIGTYYGYQAIFFLDRGGASLMVIAVMVVLVLFQRSGELHPMLAAGVPMYRVLRALMIGPVLVTAVLVANQELIVPVIAHAAHGGRGIQTGEGGQVEPIYDYSTKISINGEKVSLAESQLEGAQFVLPAPLIVHDLTIIRGTKAIFRKAAGQRPDGWVIFGAIPQFEELALTPRGQEIVRKVGRSGELFIASPVSCDQLFKRKSSSNYLSTSELLGRIRNEAYGPLAVQKFVTQVHGRLTQPLINLIAVLLSLPLLVRRESAGLVMDSGVCAVAQGILFGMMQLSAYLSTSGIIAADLAAWFPVFIGGAMAAWTRDMIRS